MRKREKTYQMKCWSIIHMTWLGRLGFFTRTIWIVTVCIICKIGRKNKNWKINKIEFNADFLAFTQSEWRKQQLVNYISLYHFVFLKKGKKTISEKHFQVVRQSSSISHLQCIRNECANQRKRKNHNFFSSALAIRSVAFPLRFHPFPRHLSISISLFAPSSRPRFLLSIAFIASHSSMRYSKWKFMCGFNCWAFDLLSSIAWGSAKIQRIKQKKHAKPTTVVVEYQMSFLVHFI